MDSKTTEEERAACDETACECESECEEEREYVRSYLRRIKLTSFALCVINLVSILHTSWCNNMHQAQLNKVEAAVHHDLVELQTRHQEIENLEQRMLQIEMEEGREREPEQNACSPRTPQPTSL